MAVDEMVRGVGVAAFGQSLLYLESKKLVQSGVAVGAKEVSATDGVDAIISGNVGVAKGEEGTYDAYPGN